MDNIENLPGEQWREVQDYDGKYLVSSLGRIKSLKHTNARILRTFVNNKGYPRVALSKNGQSRYWLVSRLVAQAFCENTDPERNNTVDHIDGNTLNNTASNLRWMSLTENIKLSFDRRKKNETQ